MSGKKRLGRRSLRGAGAQNQLLPTSTDLSALSVITSLKGTGTPNQSLPKQTQTQTQTRTHARTHTHTQRIQKQTTTKEGRGNTDKDDTHETPGHERKVAPCLEEKKTTQGGQEMTTHTKPLDTKGRWHLLLRRKNFARRARK